jgi:hypothetical protein
MSTVESTTARGAMPPRRSDGIHPKWRTRRRPSEDKFNARYQFSAFSFQRLTQSGDETADSCQLIADSQKRSEP